ncbi:hypothetical protein SAMN05216371_3840 [Streptomyces sp. TLI_053]|uniref:hypothetical protein n=1 Tax=Streptomyces sp. TLI_053 TaxID=1855352 RepID=UPI00087D4F65|nr:hypothetical protein [Streptomyces sp. TLI_053]SDT69660.1 hypothetical protein SAMN05216371_3840 [Streptomyces sp. TLI_053]
MSAAPADRADVEQLLHLVDRAARGALLPGEAEMLREGIGELARYREWCTEWSRRHLRLRHTARQRLLALRRALARAQRGRLVEAELAHLQARLDAAAQPAVVEQHAYEELLAAELLDGWALARGRAAAELAAAGLQPAPGPRSAAPPAGRPAT